MYAIVYVCMYLSELLGKSCNLARLVLSLSLLQVVNKFLQTSSVNTTYRQLFACVTLVVRSH